MSSDICMCGYMRVCVCSVWMSECSHVYGGCVWVCLVKRGRLERTVCLLIINCLFVVRDMISWWTSLTKTLPRGLLYSVV